MAVLPKVVSFRAIPERWWIVGAFVACIFLYCPRQANAQNIAAYGIPDSGLARLDFSKMYLDEQSQYSKNVEAKKAKDKQLVDSGLASVFDLGVSNKALEEFNRANSLMNAQKSREAIPHLQKAIAAEPKFVSAHLSLGLAYMDQDDAARAKGEFATAAKLDDKFALSFVNLGLLALTEKDFATAQTQLEHAVTLRPTDAKVLSALAYAQNGNHGYREAMATAQRIHGLEHKGMANVHYVAAACAIELKDFDSAERELTLFLNEDPTNAMAPVARHNLEALVRRKQAATQAATAASSPGAGTAEAKLQTFPNSDRLKAELNAVGGEQQQGAPGCEGCGPSATSPGNANPPSREEALSMPPRLPARMWTLHKTVDEVAIFFSASSHGQMINDLELSDIKIRDDSKSPEKILQMTPQSKLPLRLALVVDTSGSVKDRFTFEKHAAEKFVQKMIRSDMDLGFVVGFATETKVTQDFTADPAELGKGIEQLSNGGGTALFDAVSFACSKLAAYPEHERVARVVIILSDGEDNSSHSSLKQAVEDAETTGVTIYSVSTREDSGPKSDADRVLEVFAERTGGSAMFPGDVLALGKSLDTLRELIRSRYLVAYRPADFEPNGHYRSIQIIAEKAGKPVQIHTRRGYYARRRAVLSPAQDQQD